MTQVAVLVVVYPQAGAFLNDFFVSLQKQTIQDFTLVVVNDGLQNYNFDQWQNMRFHLEVLKGSAGFMANRRIGIEYLVEKSCQEVIFTDADDYYALNRIEKSLELLEKHEIVVNDFDLVERNGTLMKRAYLSKRIKNRMEISEDFIRNKNIFGFGNCAVRASLLTKAVFNEDVIAADWFIFSNWLLGGAKAIFTDETTTYHRIYEENLASLENVDAQNVRNGIRAKLSHYRGMAAYDSLYQGLYERLKGLEQKITNDPAFFKSYLERLQVSSFINPLWYEEIQEEAVYD